MLVAEMGDFFMEETSEGYTIFKRGDGFSTEVARYWRFGDATNKILALAS